MSKQQPPSGPTHVEPRPFDDPGDPTIPAHLPDHPEYRPMPETPSPGKKPWWQSKTILSIGTAVLWFLGNTIASLFGLDISFLKDGFQPDDLIPLAALAVAVWGRLKATKKIG